MQDKWHNFWKQLAIVGLIVSLTKFGLEGELMDGWLAVLFLLIWVARVHYFEV